MNKIFENALAIQSSTRFGDAVAALRYAVNSAPVGTALNPILERAIVHLFVGYLRGSERGDAPALEPTNPDDFDEIMVQLGRSFPTSESSGDDYLLMREVGPWLFKKGVGSQSYAFDGDGGWFATYSLFAHRTIGMGYDNRRIDHRDPTVFKPGPLDHWWYKYTTGAERATYRKRLAYQLVEKAILEGKEHPLLGSLRWSETDYENPYWERASEEELDNLPPYHDFVLRDRAGRDIFVAVANTKDQYYRMREAKCEGRAVVLIEEKLPKVAIFATMLGQIASQA